MATIAAGRIAFWEGGSLWALDVTEEDGKPTRRAPHAHHAFQVTFALGGSFGLYLEDRVLRGPVGLVAPDTRHAFEARGTIAHLFIEPQGRTGRALAALLDGAQAAENPAAFSAFAAQIEQAFLDTVDPAAALRQTGMAICDSLGGSRRSLEPDRRIRQVIQWAGENLDGTIGIGAAARRIGLSTSRLRHLFVEETGIPFRQFVLWLRLVRAVEAYAAGSSLTQAAHEAGFADSAHLSRTFRRMFGLPAASLKLS